MAICSFGHISLPKHSRLYTFMFDFQEIYAPLHGYLGLVLCVIGIVTNLLNIIVLTRQSMRTSINAILVGVAIADIAVMTSYSGYIYRFRFVEQTCSGEHYNFFSALYIIYHSQVTLVAHTVSLYLTVMMAQTRYLTLKYVYKPDFVARFTWNRTWFAITIVFLSISMINLPSFLSFTVVHQPMTVSDCSRSFNITQLPSEYQKGYFSKLSNFAVRNNCFLLKIVFWITGILFKLIPCILLIVLFGLLIQLLNEFNLRRRKLKSSFSRVEPNSSMVEGQNPRNLRNVAALGNSPTIENGQPAKIPTDKTTKMLICVAVVFLITELPQGILAMGTAIFDDRFRLYIYNRLGDFMDLLSLLNSATNFSIYCSMSSKFRKVFCETFRISPKILKWRQWKRVPTNQNNNLQL